MSRRGFEALDAQHKGVKGKSLCSARQSNEQALLVTRSCGVADRNRIPPPQPSKARSLRPVFTWLRFEITNARVKHSV